MHFRVVYLETSLEARLLFTLKQMRSRVPCPASSVTNGAINLKYKIYSREQLLKPTISCIHRHVSCNLMANLSDKEKEAYPAREGVAESNPRQHSKCMKKLEHAMKRSKCANDT